MPFSLYIRPGPIYFLDDSPEFLESISETLPVEWCVRLFLSPIRFIEQLIQEPALWESDAWRHQEMVNRWRDGDSLIRQVLSYWRTNGTARFALAQTCVVDFAMPAMSGLRVLSEVRGWGGSRIMLSGRADDKVLVSAFNRKLIDLFISKGSADIRHRIIAAASKLRNSYRCRYTQIWRSTLSSVQDALISDPSVHNSLAQLAQENKWVEYVVMGSPFGVLALDCDGSVSWLQLMINGSSSAQPHSERHECSAGHDQFRLLEEELKPTLGMHWMASLGPIVQVGGERHQFCGMLTELPDILSPGSSSSYTKFRLTHADRTVEN